MILKIKNKNILFDKRDYKKIMQYTWHITNHGYVSSSLYGYFDNSNKKVHRTLYMHRLIMNPSGRSQCVDHINGNRLDNRRSNLRLCSKSENLDNSRKFKGSSKYIGVYWDKNRNKWQANISIKNRHIHIGGFDLEEDAAKARDAIALRFRGKFARLNFPESKKRKC